MKTHTHGTDTQLTDSSTTSPETDENGRVYISYISFEWGLFKVYTYPFSAGEIRNWQWLVDKFAHGLAFLSIDRAQELARKLNVIISSEANITVSQKAYFDARRAATDNQ